MTEPICTERRGRVVCGMVMVLALAAVGQTTSTAGPASPPADFQPYTWPVEGGRIDWDRGVILAEGVGKARGKSVRHRLMAQRAAELVAARNALAIVEDIRVGNDGQVGNIAEGVVRVRGTVRGYKVVEANWQPEAIPPTCRVTLEVPLWGARGVAAAFIPASAVAGHGQASSRVRLEQLEPPSDGPFIVIDARGLEFTPCLLPEIVDPARRTVAVCGGDAGAEPARRVSVHYVRSRLSFAQLGMPAETQPAVRETGPARSTAPGGDDGRVKSDPAGSDRVRPNLSPAYLAVQATSVAGTRGTQLVVSHADAARLQQRLDTASTPPATAWIVVDH